MRLQTISDKGCVLMQFFSIYDLLLSKAAEKNVSVEDMISFFHSRKIKKKTALKL